MECDKGSLITEKGKNRVYHLIQAQGKMAIIGMSSESHFLCGPPLQYISFHPYSIDSKAIHLLHLDSSLLSLSLHPLLSPFGVSPTEITSLLPLPHACTRRPSQNPRNPKTLQKSNQRSREGEIGSALHLFRAMQL